MEEDRNSKTRNARLADAGRSSVASTDPITNEKDLLAELSNLVLGPLKGELSDIHALAMRAGVSAEDMADVYIPTVARHLGEQWCTDEVGFAEVTIGSARLQAMLRELGEEWAADQWMNPDASTVLLVVPDGTHHTLGAFVLTGQLRRKGLSVRLLLGATSQSIYQPCAHTQFDAVFISASIGDKLETLRKIVDSIKVAHVTVPPVVIGGSLLETTADVVALTGADYTAKTADEAITLCNLRTKSRFNITMVR